MISNLKMDSEYSEVGETNPEDYESLVINKKRITDSEIVALEDDPRITRSKRVSNEYLAPCEVEYNSHQYLSRGSEVRATRLSEMEQGSEFYEYSELASIVNPQSRQSKI